MASERFRRAIDAIDMANAGDPHRITVRGATRPKELAHAELRRPRAPAGRRRARARRARLRSPGSA